MSLALVAYSAADYLKDLTSSDRSRRHIFELNNDTFVDIIFPLLDIGDIFRLRRVRDHVSNTQNLLILLAPSFAFGFTRHANACIP